MLSLILSNAALCLLAMVFVVWPILVGWRSAQGEAVHERADVNVELYREHKAELEQSLAGARITANEFDVLLRELDLSLLAEETSTIQARSETRGGRFLLFSLLPLLVVFSVTWYFYSGAAQDVEIAQLASEKYTAEQRVMRGLDTGEKRLNLLPQLLQSKLEQRLEARPENTQYWYLLARTAMEQSYYAKAQSAYEQILQREAENTQIMAELAQARFLAAGNRIDPVIDSLVTQVLAVDERNTTALGLAGISAFGKTDYLQAVIFWRRAVAVMGADAPSSQALLTGITRAQQLSGDATSQVASAPVRQAFVDNDKIAAISVYVSLADVVETSPEQVVFVYARAWQGGKMPLAIIKLQVADLPRLVVLDASMAMAAGMGLDSVEQLQLVARLSKSGGVTPTAGDWQAITGPLRLDDENNDLKLMISEPVL